ncbi:MAG: hypothetical protein C4538_04855 [Nitrospiraceae bacterium]|nr:MAG: hypothetical protein C4538_04855 [Nitrospiraceae bacterium]
MNNLDYQSSADNGPAILASVPGHICNRSIDLFKVVPFFTPHLKAFRAMVFSKLFSLDQQVAVPAPQPFFLAGQEYEGFMAA